ncbi:MAG: AMP-binding protein, partial [bacterium]|nr:AMP-binding protein [bacterium]
MFRFISHFVNILGEVTANPMITLAKINMLSEAEEKQLLYEFNDTEADYPKNITIHQLFEDQVRKTAGHTALQFENSQLTYDELNKRANRLAWALKGNNFKPGTIVGLMMERSLEMIVAILGILKAGGAYLPLFPGLPNSRIQDMIEDTRIQWLLTKEHILEDFSRSRLPQSRERTDTPLQVWTGLPRETENAGNQPMADIILIAVEKYAFHRVNGEWPQPRHENLSAATTADNLSYVIYTSGSTGKPKGVAVAHGSVVNTLLCRKENYGMNWEDSALQLFSYAFDGFVTSFFTPVISGAKVVLLAEGDLKDIEKIKRIVGRSRITHILSVPGLFRAILELLDETELKTLSV